ncbi:MAG: T9SS type A sorting domain-containing protein [Bacteroidia bacterium]
MPNPDVAWTAVIGGNQNESDPAIADDDAEITIDNANDYLYLGAKTYSTTNTPPTTALTTKYLIVGVAPTYTQSINGQNDGVITAFEIGSVHRTFIGINELKNLSANGLLVYPNPTNYDLNVKLTNFKDKYTYIVYNSLGQQVLTGQLNKENSTVYLLGLKAGMYLLEINDGKERRSTKFVKDE